MGKGQGSLRRAANEKIGAFVAVLVLALSIPGIAFAANTASFSSTTPKAGSSTSAAKPTVSVVVYDKYGVKGSSNYSMTFDGVKAAAKVSYYSGYGYKKFRLSYAVPSVLAGGTHKVAVKVKDVKAKSSSYAWSFTALDKVAPVTTADVAGPYTGSATIHLTASDNTRIAHTYYSIDFGPAVEGTAVTISTAGSHSLAFFSADAAGNVEKVEYLRNLVGVVVNAAPVAAFVHPTPTISCTVAGCHAKNVAAIHTGLSGKGCFVCHANDVAATSNCTAAACHGTTPPANHGADHLAIASVPTTEGAPSCTQAGCHGTAGVVAIHTGGCATCHASPYADVTAVVNAGNATCEACHYNAYTADYAAIHKAGATKHTTQTGACFNSQCHPSDPIKIHTTWANAPGCAACHAAGKTPSLVCADCHKNVGSVHDFKHVDASGTKSAACTACHGTDLPAVHQNVGCICHTATFLTGEMGPLLTAGKAECVDCHKGDYAAHGFNAGDASGHSTTTYGKKGAYTMWDGSQGVLVKDSLNSTVTASFPFPDQNVFWSATDTAAPTGAVKGLDATSVITCEDCHAGLKSYEVSGPHGASVIAAAGIDPNFSGGFDTAFLWDGTDTMANTSGGAPSSGIGRYVPGGTTAAEKQELANWDVGNASLGTTGPATVYNGNDVICAKCHDLYNAGTGDLGWASYAHEHHANRPVSFGVYQMSDGTTVTAEATPTTGVVAKVLSKPSLGREGAGACRNCHVAVPHGWKRPRLIVYSTDPAPYNIGPAVYEGEPITGTSIGSGQMNGLASQPITSISGGITTVFTGPLSTSDPALGTGNYNNWTSSQCNACGHHSSTKFDGSTSSSTRNGVTTTTTVSLGSWK